MEGFPVLIYLLGLGNREQQGCSTAVLSSAQGSTGDKQSERENCFVGNI